MTNEEIVNSFYLNNNKLVIGKTSNKDTTLGNVLNFINSDTINNSTSSTIRVFNINNSGLPYNRKSSNDLEENDLKDYAFNFLCNGGVAFGSSATKDKPIVTCIGMCCGITGNIILGGGVTGNINIGDGVTGNINIGDGVTGNISIGTSNSNNNLFIGDNNGGYNNIIIGKNNGGYNNIIIGKNNGGYNNIIIGDNNGGYNNIYLRSTLDEETKQFTKSIFEVENLSVESDKSLIDRKYLNDNHAKLLTKNITWTVGTGGDYEDLQTAINEASKYNPTTGIKISIKLKSGFVWDKIITINNKDLSYVELVSEDSEVTADGNVMTYNDINQYFISLNNSRIVFKILLNCINMNSNTYKHGISVSNGSFISIPKNYGCKGANWNILIANASSANLYEAIFDNAIINGILVQNSIVNARTCSIKNCSTGVHSEIGGIINCTYSDFTDTLSKSNIPFNQVTKNGIIFNEGE